MRPRLRRGDGDRGATLVEFALIAPLFFLLLGSMLDIGLAVLGRSVASNAAREGARVGIIQFADADQDTSPAYLAIEAAAEAKLVGLVAPDTAAPAFVEVRCLHGVTKAPLGGTGTCARSAVTVDRDLIEVTVRWTSIAPAGGIFTPDTYVDRARMVIIGDGGGAGGACTGSGGAISISPAAPTPAEGDGPGTLTLGFTVSRQFSSCLTTVSYSTADGTATAPDDYVAVPPTTLIFLDGETSKTFDIEIVGDSVTELPETFTVNLANPVNATIGIGTALVTIIDDDISTVAPTPESLRQYDVDSDGKLDRVDITFDKDLQQSCGNANAFTLPTNTNNATVASVMFLGPRDVRISLTEGPNADTAATALTVALAAGCISDLDGNSATFPPTPLEDWAAPVLLTVEDETTGAQDGLFEPGDQVDFTFSEPLDPSTLGSATADVTLLGGGNGQNDSLRIAGLLSVDVNLGHGGYITQNNGSATFPGSTIELTSGDRAIRVSLVGPCSGNRCNRLGPGGPGSATFTFVPTIRSLPQPTAQPTSSPAISVRLF